MMTMWPLFIEFKIHIVAIGIIQHTPNDFFLNIQWILQNQTNMLNDIRYKNPLRFHISSDTTGHKALSSLVILDTHWTHKWYISVLPKIDQIAFSAGPPFCPVPCNHHFTGFKMVRTNETRLWVVGINNYVNTSIFRQLGHNARWQRAIGSWS